MNKKQVGKFWIFVAYCTAFVLVQTGFAQDAPFRGMGPSSEALQAMPQTAGAKGMQERHYYFEDAGREMAYSLYVPESYDPGTAAPLVIALHGYSVNNRYFPSVVPDLAELCEQYGFIFAAPMGYSPSGWYGAPMTIPGRGPAELNLPPPQSGTPDEKLRERQLSEQDVMNVLDILEKEYNIDPDRTFLMGHSMGGFGTWHLGGKYIDKWAAIAPMSGINGDTFAQLDFQKLSRIPILVSVGEQETDAVENSKKAVAALQAAGGEVRYVEIEDGSHTSMVAPSTAQILEFFSAH